MLRYINILRAKDPDSENNKQQKYMAARGLLMSVEHEAVDRYPALTILRNQFSAHSAIWDAVISLLTGNNNPEIRAVGCRIVSGLVLRSAGSSCVSSFFDYKGGQMLFSCLDIEGECAEVAAIALMQVTTKEREFWDKGEIAMRQIPTIVGDRPMMSRTIIPLDAYTALPHYAAHMYTHESLTVHDCLCMVISHLMKLPFSPQLSTILRGLVENEVITNNMGLLTCNDRMIRLSAMEMCSSVLRALASEPTSNENSISLSVNTTIRKLLDSPSTLVVVAKDMNVNDPTFTDTRALFCLEVLCSYYGNHNNLLITMNETSYTITGPAADSFFRVSKLVDYVLRLDPNTSDDPNLESLFVSAFNVLYFLAAKCTIRNSLIDASTSIDSAIKLVSLSINPRIQFACISYLFLFAYMPEFAQSLLRADDIARFLVIVCDNLVQIGSKNEPPRRSDQNMNPAVDVLCFSLYQLQVNCSALIQQSSTPNRPIMPPQNLPNVPALEIMICRNQGIWAIIEQYLKRVETCSSVLRLVHVFACSDESTVLIEIWRYVLRDGLIPLLFRYISDVNTPDEVASGALMVLGSLMGGINFYLWEAATLSRVLDRDMNSDAGPNNASSEREIAFRNLAQSRVCLPGRRDPNDNMGGLNTNYYADPSHNHGGDGIERWPFERRVELQQQVVAQCKALIFPYLDAGAATMNNAKKRGLNCCIAAIRLLHTLTRANPDNAFVLGNDPDSYKFVPRMNEFNTIFLSLALETFVTLVVQNHSGSESMQLSSLIALGMESLCNDLNSPNAVIRCRALEALSECVESEALINVICGLSMQNLLDLLHPVSHLRDPLVDSEFITHTVLTIMSKILQSSSTGLDLLRNRSFNQGMSEIINGGNLLLLTQSLHPGYYKPSKGLHHSGNRRNMVDIRDSALTTVRVIASDPKCRSTLLDSGFQDVCMHILANSLLQSNSSERAPTNDMLLQKLEEIFPYLRSLNRNAILEQNAAGISPSTGKLQRTPSTGAAQMVLERIRQFVAHYAKLVSCRECVEILYYLSSEASDVRLKTSLNKNPLSAATLLLLWCADDTMGHMITTIFMRCGVDEVQLAAQTDNPDSGIESPLASLPWSLLIQTEQIGVLTDMLDIEETFRLKSPMVGISVLDEFTVLHAQLLACDCIQNIFSAANAGGPSTPDQQQIANVVTSTKKMQQLRAMIIEMCASHRLMFHLERLAQQSFVAASLFGEFFEWRDINFRFTSPDVLNSVLNMLDSYDVNIRIVAVRVLCAAVLHSRESRLQVILKVPRLEVACFLEQLIASGFAHLQQNPYVGPNQANHQSQSTQEENHLVSDTLVASFIVITNLFAQRVDLSPRSLTAFNSQTGENSDSEFQDAELKYLAAACDGLIATIVIRTPKPQALRPGEKLLEADSITKSLWQALENLSGVKICAYVLLKRSKLTALLGAYCNACAKYAHGQSSLELGEDCDLILTSVLKILIKLCGHYNDIVAEQALGIHNSGLLQHNVQMELIDPLRALVNLLPLFVFSPQLQQQQGQHGHGHEHAVEDANEYSHRAVEVLNRLAIGSSQICEAIAEIDSFFTWAEACVNNGVEVIENSLNELEAKYANTHTHASSLLQGDTSGIDAIIENELNVICEPLEIRLSLIAHVSMTAIGRYRLLNRFDLLLLMPLIYIA
jgi:hypothetical protein